MEEITEEYIKEMTEEWGPLQKADLPLFSTIQYRWIPSSGNETVKTGEVIWTTCPGHLDVEGRPPLPMQYLVMPVGATTGFPDCIRHADIIQVISQ